MKVQTKLIFLLSLLVLIFVISFILQKELEKKRLISLFKQEKNRGLIILDKVIELKSKPLTNFVLDYTFWDDMVNFVKTQDNNWAHQNIDTALSIYDANIAWIYRPDFSLAYSVNNLKKGAFDKGSFLSKEVIPLLFFHKKVCHFFIKTHLSLIEIYGATIHTTSDRERLSPGAGYFFAGHLWNESRLMELSELIGGKIMIEPFINNGVPSTNTIPETGVIYFSKTLNDWKNKPLVNIEARVEPPFYRDFNRASNNLFLLFFLSAVPIFILLPVFLFRWVGIPLGLISRTLNTRDASYIENLQKDKSEFGDIACLMTKFFQHTDVLTNEVYERKKIEEALRASEEKMEVILGNVKDIIFQLSPRGVIEYISPSISNYGYKPEELVGQRVSKTTTPKEMLKVFDVLKNVLLGKKVNNFEIGQIDSLGNIVPMEVSVNPIIRKGKVVKVQGVLRDISERKKTEEELKNAYEQLKQTQAQLVQSSKMVAVGQLAAGVSHEINQPLAAIRGYAQVVINELDGNSSIKDDMQRIIEQSGRINKIIDNVRFFARKSDFNMEDIDVNNPINDSLGLLSEQLRIHNIRIKKYLASGLPLIRGNENQLQQVFLNLLTNARDAIDSLGRADGGEITIKSSLSEDGTDIEIMFNDNGCGISRENLSNIFNPFFTTKSPDRGMGLGLAIAYRIIDSHCGKINIESEEGKGSSVKINFPLAAIENG